MDKEEAKTPEKEKPGSPEEKKTPERRKTPEAKDSAIDKVLNQIEEREDTSVSMSGEEAEKDQVAPLESVTTTPIKAQVSMDVSVKSSSMSSPKPALKQQ